MRYLMQLRQSPSILVPLTEASPCPWRYIEKQKNPLPHRRCYGTVTCSVWRWTHESQPCVVTYSVFCVFKFIQWELCLSLNNTSALTYAHWQTYCDYALWMNNAFFIELVTGSSILLKRPEWISIEHQDIYGEARWPRRFCTNSFTTAHPVLTKMIME